MIQKNKLKLFNKLKKNLIIIKKTVHKNNKNKKEMQFQNNNIKIYNNKNNN